MRAAIIRAARSARRAHRFLGAIADNSGYVSSTIQSTASALGVPPQLALNVAQTESGLNNGAVSSKGAVGIFQLMPATAAQLGVDPTDPLQNIQGGITYLSQLFQQFGNWADALAAYNWGPGNVTKYGSAAAPSSTQNYVSSILAASGPTAYSSPNAAPAAPSPADSGGSASVIDVPFSVVSDVSMPTPSLAPNWLLFAMLGVGVYLAVDVLRG